MIHQRFLLQSSTGEPIRGDLRYADRGGRRPVVVVCHGFKGFKDWGFHPYLGSRLAGAGFVALHFNFSRNGVGEGLLDFTELESFRRNTISTELSDLDVVLSSLETAFPEAPIDPGRVGLAGHSRGGGVAVVGAADHPGVRALVTWAAVSTFDRVPDPAMRRFWREQGYLEVPNARTGQILRQGVEYLDDLEANGPRIDPVSAAGRLGCPYLVLHGTADESVPFSEAEELVRGASGAVPVELRPVTGAGHTFGAVQPWAGTTPYLEEAVRATVDWFERHLGPAVGP